MPTSLDNLLVFATVAKTRNFRLAAEQLGVTRPAISQAVRRLEDQCGAALFLRTTRSVRLTQAGEELLARTGPALADIAEALTSLRDREERPTGRLKLAVSSIAEWFLAGPLFATFGERCPGVQLDITVTDDESDFVAGGFDAAVRLGEVLHQDMIAVPVSNDQRQMAVASPDYLARAGTPEHPRELARHRCIGWRPALSLAPYRWEFEENGRPFALALDPVFTTNDMRVMVRTACAGGGVTFGVEETFRGLIQSGELIPLLEDFCPPFPGFFITYPDRRTITTRLRAFVDHVRACRAAETAPQR